MPGRPPPSPGPLRSYPTAMSRYQMISDRCPILQTTQQPSEWKGSMAPTIQTLVALAWTSRLFTNRSPVLPSCLGDYRDQRPRQRMRSAAQHFLLNQFWFTVVRSEVKHGQRDETSRRQPATDNISCSSFGSVIGRAFPGCRYGYCPTTIGPKRQ